MSRRGMTPLRFRRMREQLSMQQKELASELDITQSAVSAFENGTQVINIRTAMAMKYLLLIQAVPELTEEDNSSLQESETL